MLPFPVFGGPVEDYAPRDPPATCDPEPKPGVLLFRDFVLASLGGGKGWIERRCTQGGPSHHHEGRAWDWMVSAADPADVARVETLLGWLLASDESGQPHALFRRAGLDYVIWNRQIWSGRTKNWQPYTGANPHTDHVHLSFGWPGARGETSLYDFLRGGPDEPEPVDPWWPAPSAKPGTNLTWLAAVGGFAAGYLAVRQATRHSRGVGRSSATSRR